MTQIQAGNAAEISPVIITGVGPVIIARVGPVINTGIRPGLGHSSTRLGLSVVPGFHELQHGGGGFFD